MKSALIATLMMIPMMAFAAPGSYEVAIEGMTCGGCVDSVKKALSAMPEVETASLKVILKENKATLTLKEDDPKALEKIKAAIAKAGFTVTSVNSIKTDEMKNETTKKTTDKTTENPTGTKTN